MYENESELWDIEFFRNESPTSLFFGVIDVGQNDVLNGVKKALTNTGAILVDLNGSKVYQYLAEGSFPVEKLLKLDGILVFNGGAAVDNILLSLIHITVSAAKRNPELYIAQILTAGTNPLPLGKDELPQLTASSDIASTNKLVNSISSEVLRRRAEEATETAEQKVQAKERRERFTDVFEDSFIRRTNSAESLRLGAYGWISTGFLVLGFAAIHSIVTFDILTAAVESEHPKIYLTAISARTLLIVGLLSAISKGLFNHGKDLLKESRYHSQWTDRYEVIRNFIATYEKGLKIDDIKELMLIEKPENNED